MKTHPSLNAARGLFLAASMSSLAPAAAAASALAANDVEDVAGEDAEDSEANEEDQFAASSQPALPARSATSGWRIDPGLQLRARAITAEASVRAEDEAIDGTAFAFIAIPTLSVINDDTTVTLRNITTRLEFQDEGRTDRWQNTARLTGAYNLAPSTTIAVFAERSDNTLLAEFGSTDEWELGARIEQRLDAANRVRLGASWRERTYDDSTNSRGSGLRVDGEYRYRFARNQYAFVRARYDSIASDNVRRELDRWLVEASYQHPLAPDLRVRSEFSYQRLDFTGRTLAGGGVRQDDLLWPELTLIYSPGAWTIAAEARYVVRNSTDTDFDRSGYRFELEISHAF